MTSRSLWNSLRQAGLARVLLVYLGVSFAVLEAADIFTDQLGLPGWVFPGALILLVLGLPIVVGTALVQARGVSRPKPSAVPPDVADREPLRPEPAPAAGTESAVAMAARRWLTWRKAILGSVIAFAFWGLVVSAYMTMRGLGIGPVGSLVAAGVLDERERIIVADFHNNTSDPLLGQAATEAFRIDLSQSTIVTVVDPAHVSRVLVRMQGDPHQPLDRELAREVAIREGIKAIVVGDITPVGGGFVLAAELIAAEDGRLIYGHRETASDSTVIIGAIDRLSKGLRERIGESLKTIRANEPLDRVTTASLEALRKYSQAVRVIEQGDNERGITLLEEAVALDTAFAMAYRKLGVSLSNIGRDPARRREALSKAYEHWDRLTERERYLTLGSYYSMVTGESDKAIAAYQSLLDIQPSDPWALNNLAILHLEARDYRRAALLFGRAIEFDSTGSLRYGNAVEATAALGNFSEAEQILQIFAEKFPGHPDVPRVSARLASARFDYAAAQAQVAALREAQRASPLWQLGTSSMLAEIAEVQGRLRDAERHMRDLMTVAEEQGQYGMYIGAAVKVALYDAMFRGRRDRAISAVDAALDRYPLSSIELLERPYGLLALFYAFVEQPERARMLLAQYEAAVDPQVRNVARGEEDVVPGVIALADSRPQDAIAEFRRADRGPCPICLLPLLGQAYDLAEEPDSVVAIYERYLNTPWLGRLGDADWYALAGIYERLAGLYELRGDRERAAQHYNRFIELWRDADPELQPRVQAARRALERLLQEASSDARG
ncbi:MAG: tetratricopeptide repeat protein [Gemmatimonadota bacterium]|nr:MAG: tetratricopeptide repeat protein [Gemmatimonadota bacterium]